MQTSLNKRLLVSCIFASIFLHALFLLMVQHHSIWLIASIDAKSTHGLQSMQKEQILKEAFQTLSKIETVKIPEPKKIKSAEPFAYSIPSIQSNAPEIFSPKPMALPANHLVVRPDLYLAAPLPPSRKIEPNLEKFSVTVQPNPPQPKQSTSSPQKHPEWPLALAKLMPPNVEMLHTPMIAYQSRPLDTPEMMDQSTARRALLAIPTPPLPSFPTLDELDTGSYSDFFDLDLVCLSKQGEGFLFAITIIPRSDLQLPKLHQHYNFLIDRANCIQRDRLLATKNAVLKALNELPPDDTFNIIAFDNKVEKLFPTAHPPDAVAIAQAKAFLDKINLGSFFSPSDLYNPLLLTLPEQIQDDELYTAVLMSDGDNFAKKSALHSVLQKWSWQNSGKVALFTISLNDDRQLSNLEAASTLNKDRLYIAPTKSGIKRKLLKLMKNIQSPIAKNISCHAISQLNNRTIELYPGAQELPHMYLDQPFVIMGSTESLEDFILFVQGRLKDRWMNIKKTISFVNAQKGNQSLKEEWARHQAQRCYKRYAFDANPSHLAEARDWLQPFDIQPAFQ